MAWRPTGPCYGSRMDASELADLEHENMVVAMAAYASGVSGALIRHSEGVAVISTGLSFLLFNQVIVAEAGAKPAAVAAAVGILRARDGDFVVNLRVGSDDQYVPLMAELGLVPISERPWMPGMALHPLSTNPTQAASPSHEIRQVTDEAGLDDHIQVVAAGFDLPAALMVATMVPEVLAREDVAIYVGYTDGEPVSSGLGVRTGRTIGVYSIATIAAARKRGYGAAMTSRVAIDGGAAGCDVAILQASDMGYPIYERLGYRKVVDYMGYVQPHVAHAEASLA